MKLLVTAYVILRKAGISRRKVFNYIKGWLPEWARIQFYHLFPKLCTHQKRMYGFEHEHCLHCGQKREYSERWKAYTKTWGDYKDVEHLPMKRGKWGR